MRIRNILILTVLLSAGWAFAETPLLQSEQNKIQNKTDVRQIQITPQGDSYVLEGLANSVAQKNEAAEIAHDDLKANIVNNIVVSKGDRTDQEINLDVLERIQSKTA